MDHAAVAQAIAEGAFDREVIARARALGFLPPEASLDDLLRRVDQSAENVLRDLETSGD